ncbi:MAG: TIGR03668 family PPOX class F420-dependent oxidoreductase [Thermoproteota archaeon]|nr:TIGR03668 family PPOX class F420-dependent oxidoreductase [Thermoproteota archaeon]
MTDITSTVRKFIQKARVARLATVDSRSVPHLVPVVFVFDGFHFFIPLDEKGKTTKPAKLKRIRNIQQNPNVALLIDKYSEDWPELAFVMIQGRASIANKIDENIEVRKAYRMLTTKYIQYQRVGIGQMCIMIRPEHVIYWTNSKHEMNGGGSSFE